MFSILQKLINKRIYLVNKNDFYYYFKVLIQLAKAIYDDFIILLCRLLSVFFVVMLKFNTIFLFIFITLNDANYLNF